MEEILFMGSILVFPKIRLKYVGKIHDLIVTELCMESTAFLLA